MAPGSPKPTDAAEPAPAGWPPSAAEAIVVFSILIGFAALFRNFSGEDAALGGAVVTRIDYGLKLLRPDVVYASTLVICALVAVAVGGEGMGSCSGALRGRGNGRRRTTRRRQT